MDIKMPGAEWLNKFLPKRRPDRGDVVAGLALWGFVAAAVYMLIAGLAGGSTLHVTKWGFIGNWTVPRVEIAVLTGFCMPLIISLVKAWAPTDDPRKNGDVEKPK